jgi:hypothetical protein
MAFMTVELYLGFMSGMYFWLLTRDPEGSFELPWPWMRWCALGLGTLASADAVFFLFADDVISGIVSSAILALVSCVYTMFTGVRYSMEQNDAPNKLTRSFVCLMISFMNLMAFSFFMIFMTAKGYKGL